MANFLTSFATGGLKAGINQMSRVVEERGEILDNLRPIVQEKFSLLNDNTKKYSDIYKKVSKFDGGQTAFNYFFDRGDIDTSLSTDEATKAIMDNASMIPQDYIAGDTISGQERISKMYEGGVNSINNYITDVGTKHKLGTRTSDLLLKEGNPALAGASPTDVLEQQLKVPVNSMQYAPGVLGGTPSDRKNDLLLRATVINAYTMKNLNRPATTEELMNNEIADAAGTYAIQPQEMSLYNDAIGEKDVRNNMLVELFKGYMQNEAIISNFKTDQDLSDEENLANQINNFQNIYNNLIGPLLTPSAGNAETQANNYVAMLQSRLLETEEGSEKEAEVLKEIEEYFQSNS
jgi:hypothetical protein